MASTDSPKQISLKNLSTEELVQHCKENDPRAWGEFLRRYVPVIKKMIKDILRKYHCFKWNDSDVIEDIWINVFEKLYAQNGLALCVHFNNFEGWLWTVVNSKVVDYCREKKRKGPDIEPNDKPIDDMPENENCLERMLRETESDDLNKILGILSDIKNPKIMWTMRLAVMAYAPLTGEEIKSLAAIYNHEEKALRDLLKNIHSQLYDKIDEKRKAGDGADKIWHQIRELEYQLEKVIPFINVGNEEAIDKIKQKIKQKRKRYLELIHESQQFCRPSNAEIAEIIGFSELKINQISIYLMRAREILIEQRKKKLFEIK